jgi:ubiquinone/menaquinone biosynthesis C-methylase UbiE/Tfp pilus assembly protein PilF
MDQPMMQFSGERFVPEVKGQIAYEHFHRYHAASEFVTDKIVLDIASGEGYGSALLAAHARAVVGVEISREAVEHAQCRYAGVSNLRFVEGSCEHIPLENASVDVVVSFETIEHIEDHNRFLEEVARVLKPNGLFILSSPNKKIYTEAADHHNPFHLHELDRTEFEATLARVFPYVQLCGQRLTFSSYLWPLESSTKVEFGKHYSNAFQDSCQPPFEPEYFVALCAKEHAPLPLVSSLYTHTNDELLTEYHSRGRWGQALDMELKDREATIHSLKNEIVKLNSKLLLHERSAPAVTNALLPTSDSTFLCDGEPDDEAIERLRQLLKKEPRHAVAHNDLGTLLFKQGDVAAAREHFLTAVEFSEDNLAARKNLADLLLASGDSSAALRHYQAVLGMQPHDVDALISAGGILRLTRRYASSAYHLKHALELDPENTAAQTLFELLQQDAPEVVQSAVATQTTMKSTRSAKRDSLRLSVTKLGTLKESDAHYSRMRDEHARRAQALQRRIPSADAFTIPGHCYLCQRDVEFKVDFRYAYAVDGVRVPNWREHLVCPSCGLNNRLRASIQFFEQVFLPKKDAAIYITEQCTPMYDLLKRHYTNTIGSEYLGDAVPFGIQNKNGTRNESLTQLTFDDKRFDFVIAFEVFEHIPDFTRAMKECHRVLKDDGKLIFTVPFVRQAEGNIVRALVHDDGSVEHFLPAEYHGDPVNGEGCLAYYHFGWEMFDQLRDAGFDDVAAYSVWSDALGNLGDEQLMFVAVKPKAFSTVARDSGYDNVTKNHSTRAIVGAERISAHTNADVDVMENQVVDSHDEIISIGGHELTILRSPRHTRRDELLELYWHRHPRFTFLKNAQRNANFLDLGAGSGGLVTWKEWLSPKRDDIRMYAVDMVTGEFFKRYLDFQLCNLDSDPLKFSSGFFDAVLSSHLLEHVRDEARLLAELRRVTQRGARLYIEVPTPSSQNLPHRQVFIDAGINMSTLNFFDDATHLRTFSLEQLATLVSAAGFKPLTMGVIDSKYIEDEMLTYGVTHNDSEVTTYAMWSKMHFAHYIISEAV